MQKNAKLRMSNVGVLIFLFENDSSADKMTLDKKVIEQRVCNKITNKASSNKGSNGFRAVPIPFKFCSESKGLDPLVTTFCLFRHPCAQHNMPLPPSEASEDHKN